MTAATNERNGGLRDALHGRFVLRQPISQDHGITLGQHLNPGGALDHFSLLSLKRLASVERALDPRKIHQGELFP